MIDKRRTYYLLLDTETVNNFGVPLEKHGLFYDIGAAVIDKKGKVYQSFRAVNKDIFEDTFFMNSCYYKNKLPFYAEGLQKGFIKYLDTLQIQQDLLYLIKKYNISILCAHNARFDKTVLDNTIQFVTRYRKKYFFPFDMVWYDTLKMSKDIFNKSTYKEFSVRYGTLTQSGRLSYSAENLYKFISNNPDFIESHTGLEDVLIEKEIFAYCFRQKKKMRRLLYEE